MLINKKELKRRNELRIIERESVCFQVEEAAKTKAQDHTMQFMVGYVRGISMAMRRTNENKQGISNENQTERCKI